MGDIDKKLFGREGERVSNSGLVKRIYSRTCIIFCVCYSDSCMFVFVCVSVCI